MRDELALLAAYAADPDDELTRLALADWFEERGDVRGAWLRDPSIASFMHPDASDPIPRLIERFEADALGRIGAPAVGPLLSALLSSPYDLQEAMRRLLTSIAEGDPRWGSTLTQLRTPYTEGRLVSLAEIRAIGVEARTLVGPLLDLLDTDSDATRVADLEAIAALGLPDALRIASARLEYDDLAGQSALTSIVARMGVGSPVFDMLVDQLGSYNRSVTEAAMAELERIGIDATPHLIEAYDRLHGHFEPVVSSVLHSFGPDVVPLLVEAVNRGARGPIHALGVFGEGPHRDQVATLIIPELLGLIGVIYGFDYETAIEGLGKFGPAAAPIVPELMAHLESRLPEESGPVIATLRAIGPAAAPALPLVRRLVRDRHSRTRQEAIRFVHDLEALG